MIDMGPCLWARFWKIFLDFKAGRKVIDLCPAVFTAGLRYLKKAGPASTILHFIYVFVFTLNERKIPYARS